MCTDKNPVWKIGTKKQFLIKNNCQTKCRKRVLIEVKAPGTNDVLTFQDTEFWFIINLDVNHISKHKSLKYSTLYVINLCNADFELTNKNSKLFHDIKMF